MSLAEREFRQVQIAIHLECRIHIDELREEIIAEVLSGMSIFVDAMRGDMEDMIKKLTKETEDMQQQQKHEDRQDKQEMNIAYVHQTVSEVEATVPVSCSDISISSPRQES